MENKYSTSKIWESEREQSLIISPYNLQNERERLKIDEKYSFTHEK
jgi:hypothetical protein